MNVSGANAANAATPPQNAASTQLSKNFNNFLLLLTQQLKMQDPLQPMDTEKFTQQLVQFASVEQQIASNTKLDNLVSLEKGRSSGAALSYIGKVVEAKGSSLPLTGSSGQFTYTLEDNAKVIDIKIVDSKGNTVRTMTGPLEAGKHRMDWDGRNSSGAAMPEGTYRIQIAAKDHDGNEVKATTTVFGLITDVDLSGDNPRMLLGKTQISIDDVLSVRATAANADRTGSALGYLGKVVEATSDRMELLNKDARIGYKVGPDAATVRISIFDKDGKKVATRSGSPEAGWHEFKWNGLDSAGAQSPDGVYRVAVEAFDFDGNPVTTQTAIAGQVTGVEVDGGEPILNVGKVKIKTGDVLSIF